MNSSGPAEPTGTSTEPTKFSTFAVSVLAVEAGVAGRRRAAPVRARSHSSRRSPGVSVYCHAWYHVVILRTRFGDDPCPRLGGRQEHPVLDPGGTLTAANRALPLVRNASACTGTISTWPKRNGRSGRAVTVAGLAEPVVESPPEPFGDDPGHRDLIPVGGQVDRGVAQFRAGVGDGCAERADDTRLGQPHSGRRPLDVAGRRTRSAGPADVAEHPHDIGDRAPVEPADVGEPGW